MIGTMDTYIEIEESIETRNSLNEPEITWQLVTPAWASKRLKSSSEGAADDQLNSKGIYELKLHYEPEIKDDRRINIDGEYFNIIGHDHQFRKWTIVTIERTSYERRC